jgi:hypothetical protein
MGEPELDKGAAFRYDNHPVGDLMYWQERAVRVGVERQLRAAANG